MSAKLTIWKNAEQNLFTVKHSKSFRAHNKILILAFTIKAFMKFFRFFLFLLLISANTYSQDAKTFLNAEDSLKKIGKVILTAETDFEKYNANDKFLTLLESTLLQKNSFEYPFDSLTTIAHLTSLDNKFRIFNWVLPKSDGTYEYFGIIQKWSKKEKKYILYKLKDNSEKILKPENELLDYQNWYGALYYKIIYTTYAGKKYYTLLGWDGNNKITSKKIIDVLSFNSKEKPVFGANVFKFKSKTQKRVIYEFAATSTMSVKYEKQYMLHGKKKRKMIVFDRISPLDPKLEGMYQYYYPETNIFDAFLFKNGKWNYTKDIDARNNKESKADRKRKNQIIKEQNEHLNK
jgi:hypothetical protein